MPRVDNMLKITNDGRKLALDQRLVNELLPDAGESKICLRREMLSRNMERTGKRNRRTQLIFCDLSTPKS